MLDLLPISFSEFLILQGTTRGQGVEVRNEKSCLLDSNSCTYR